MLRIHMHQAPYITAQNGPWYQNLVGIGSEWAVMSVQETAIIIVI